MAITHGVHASAGSTNGNTAATPSRDSQATGTFVVGVVAGGGTPTVADNKGNSANYELVGSALSSSAGSYAIVTRYFLCLNGTGGAGHIVTATSTGQYPSVFFQEVNSDNPLVLDFFAQQVDAATPFTSGANTPSANGAALVGFMGHNPASNPTVSAGNGFTLQESVNDTGAFYPGALEAQIQATAASIEASFTSTVNPGNALVHVLALVEDGGGTEYTLTADGAAFVHTGAAAGLLAGRRVSADAAAFAMVGADATLTYDALGAYTLDAAGAAYALVGAAVDLRAGRRVAADAAAFTLTGADATLVYAVDYTLDAAAGSYALTGAAATLVRGWKITAEAGAFALAGGVGGPTLGSHTLEWDHEDEGSNPHTSDPITTVSGSRLRVSVGAANALDNPPTDNYDNEWARVGSRINFTEWSGYGVSVWEATNIAGGAGHTVSISKAAAPTAEISMYVVEIRGATSTSGGMDEDLISTPLTSDPVTTSGPALLYAHWWGDNAGGSPHTAVAGDGFTALESALSPGSNMIQTASAYKVVDAAGTYDVTWAETPNQGALLGLFAFEGGSAATNLRVDRVLSAESGAFGLTGADVTLAYSAIDHYVLDAAGAAYVVSGADAALLAGRVLAAASGAVALTGNAADLRMGRNLVAEAGALVLTGSDAGLLATRRLAADAGAFSLVGTDANLVHTPVGSYLLIAGAGAFALTGMDATIAAARRLAADGAAFALTGADTDAALGRRLSADAGSYALVGAEAALLYAPVGSYVLGAAAGAFVVLGADVELTYTPALSYTLTAATAVFTLSGGDVAWPRTYRLEAAPATFIVTGAPAGLFYGLAAPPLVPIIATRPDSFADGPVYRPAATAIVAERP